MTPQPTLEELGERPFSFYPPLLGVEHNEWTYVKSTWSEIQVHNTKTDQSIWIPRRFVGEVSQVDEPIMIVGLLKELEYRGGTVWPHERRLVEMSKPVSEPTRAATTEAAAPPRTVARMGGAESKVGRFLAYAIGAGLLLCVAVVLIMREGGPGNRVVYNTVLQSDLGFTGTDDYYAVVNRFGPPAEDRWRSDQGELQYRLLWYPDRGLYIVLMGPDRKDVHYIGALDKNWRVVHAIDNNKEAMLRRLVKF
jgi:hypothetical protein